jgi:hypothetical protein
LYDGCKGPEVSEQGMCSHVGDPGYGRESGFRGRSTRFTLGALCVGRSVPVTDPGATLCQPLERRVSWVGGTNNADTHTRSEIGRSWSERPSVVFTQPSSMALFGHRLAAPATLLDSPTCSSKGSSSPQHASFDQDAELDKKPWNAIDWFPRVHDDLHHDSETVVNHTSPIQRRGVSLQKQPALPRSGSA